MNTSTLTGPLRTVVQHTRSSVRSLVHRVRSNPRSSGSTALLAAGAVALVVAMFLAEGFRADSYDLDDAAVWVVNSDRSSFGRINTDIPEQDGVQNLPGDGEAALEVLQDGETVYVRSPEGDWSPVDPSRLTAGEAFTLPKGSQSGLAGGHFALLTEQGGLHVVDADQGATLAADDGRVRAEPVATFGEGSQLQVGRRGDAAVADPAAGRVTVVERRGATRSFDAELTADRLQVSLADRDAVALSGSTLWLPDGSSVQVDGEGPVLQLPGDDPDHVLVASSTGLWEFPVDGGDAKRLAEPEGTAKPIPPVRVGGCTWGSWKVSPAKIYWDCGGYGDAPPPAKVLDGPEVDGPESLVFRVNRSRVVLNGTRDGTVLVVAGDKVVPIDEWNPETIENPDESDESGEREEALSFDSDENRPPEARDDDFGARPGLPSIIPVLDNDTDADNDVLTIADVDQVQGGTVQLVQGGQALQVVPEVDASQVRFRYRAFDGQARSDQPADVTVRVFGADTQSAPELKAGREPEFTVGARSTATYPVLDDWIDPEGDPIRLEAASVPRAAGARVSAQTDGLLTYVDEAGAEGTQSVSVTVADAPLLANVGSESADGTVTVRVTPDGQNSPPVARNDFATTVAGQPVVIWPVRNDSDPDGDDLSFTLLPKDGLPEGVVDNGDGSVTVTPDAAAAAQAVLFGYEASDGAASAQARIRVDVLAPDTAEPPTAGLDLIVLPAPSESGRAGERVQDLLVNDYSPTGAVMVVTSITAEGAPVRGLEVQLIEHRRMRVAYAGQLTRPAQFTYTLSDGTNEAVGRAVVISSASAQNLAPLAIDDEVSVRAGDLVSVPVLANDLDPEGASLHLSAELAQGPAAGEGLAFVSGPRVRFLAPDRAATVELTYVVSDDPDPLRGNSTTGRLRITVRDSSDNAAPVPPSVEARVLAGSRVEVTVPLTGVDPDGDSVSLVGLGLAGSTPNAPSKGRIVDVGLDSFTYEAFPDSSGTDQFRYRVVDSGGPDGTPQAGEGTIRIGIAPRPPVNQAPTARSDQYDVRPGSSVLVDPLSNDYDPDGDPIALAAQDAIGATTGGLEAAEDEGRVRLEVPDDEASFSVGYRIEDVWGDQANGTINVVSDPDAPGRPPIARDDLAAPEADATEVAVAVLVNDEDPDGPADQLRISTIEGVPGQVRVEGSTLVVGLTGRTQVVPYQVTDEQGLTAVAVVRVPAAGESVDLPPRLIDPAAAIVLRDGAPTTVQLSDYVEDPEGADVRFESARVAAVRVAASVLSPTELEVSDPDVPAGDAAVSIVVTDAPEGQPGQTVVLTLPVRIESSANQPPIWVSGLEIQVSRDDEEVYERDLTRLVQDPDDRSTALTFSVLEQPDGVDVSANDGRLRAVAEGDLTVGAELDPVVVRVQDADGEQADATFPVRVIDTSKPLAVVPPQRVDAEAGVARPVDVLANAVNPFDDAPLVIVPRSGLVSQGRGEVSVSEDQVTFTPGADFVGTAVVTFRVADKVGREVPGTVTYTVRAKPGPPGRPRAVQQSSRSVQVNWSAADANDSPITNYTVIVGGRGSSGGASISRRECGTGLSCLIDGLTPGSTYTFQVVATNALGDSEPSEASVPVRPDECAGAPQNVQLTFDAEQNPRTGGQLVASWDEPQNDGTPIEGYEVRVSPAGSQSLPELVRDTEVVIDGLQNGVPHTVTVRARNRCEGLFGESSQSSPQTPAGVPDAPAGPQARRIDDRAGGRVEVSWVPPSSSGSPSDNGDRVSGYLVVEVGDQRPPQQLDPASLATVGGRVTTELSVNRNGGPYSFQVIATNKAGDSAASSVTAPVTAPGVPGVVTGVSAVVNQGSTGLDGRAIMQFTGPSDDGGAAVQRYEYQIGDGAWIDFGQSIVTSSPWIVNGLTNGTPYRFRMRACNEAGCSDPSAQTAEVVPYGPVPPPNVSTARPSPTRVRFSWSPSDPDGNGRPYDRVEVNWGAGWQVRGLSDSVDLGDNYGQSFTITVRLFDSAGQFVDRQASASTDPPPTITAVQQFTLNSIIWNNAFTRGSSIGSFPAGGTATIRCYSVGIALGSTGGDNVWYFIEGGPSWPAGYVPRSDFGTPSRPPSLC